MHAVKVGWVGQTFALARCSDAHGKRSRNRISKEERKTLVEKFVKKYQQRHDGTFPSLNLTHKEVGGSFYTVREIVREIIQENRILGPGDSALKVLTLEDCGDRPLAGSLSLDDGGGLSLLMNGWAGEGSLMEGQYGCSEHGSVSKGVVAAVDMGSVGVNGASDVDESDDLVVSPSERFIFPQTLEVVASGDELDHSHEISFFHGSSQDVDSKASQCNGTLQSEKETYHEDSPLEEEYHIEASLATAASSSSNAILERQSESDTSSESSRELFSPSVGVPGSNYSERSSSAPAPPSSASDVIVAMESGHINYTSFGETSAYSSEVAEPAMALEDTEISGEVALKIFDVSVELENHSPLSHDKVVPSSEHNGWQQEFKEKGEFIASFEETELDYVVEQSAEIVLVNEVLREDDQSEGVVSMSNIVVDEVPPVCKPPASAISGLSMSEISEGKVAISAVKSQKTHITQESTTSGKSKEEPTAYGTAPRHVTSSTGVTEHMLVEADGQSTVDSSKPQNVPHADPFWDALKKIFTAFIKFWTE